MCDARYAMNYLIWLTLVSLLFLGVGCSTENLSKQTNMQDNVGLIEGVQNQVGQLLTNPHADLDRGLLVEV